MAGLWGGSNPAKTKGLKILSLSRKDKQREGMPIKGTGGSSQGEGKKKKTDGRGENR